ncbi:MAG: S-layer homology domain-containing protein, partial [Clostridiales bacterium]|nr:S-layer homology domain-containing protein [Clostridiales bacterium]
MIYVIRNGGNDDASAHANNPTSFTDLTDSWYQGYIKYLQNTGIVAGKTATQFDPDGNVTTGEALKMALVLGGYRADKAGLTGTKWLTNTVTLATTNRLLNDVNSSITGACTRQDAAQILANALDMTAVRYSEIVEDFVNDSEDGLALGGSSISVGRKWMDLWTNVGTLISIDGSDLDIQMSSSDRTDSDSDDEHFVKVDTDYSSLLGQKVKVLFKDGKNNSVLGVYPIDDNSVVTVNQNEISVDAGKIVIDDESYSVETDGVTVIRDGEELNENWKAGAFKDQQSADVITLIDTDDNNKIDTAYIKTVDVAKVTYVASSQIIAGSKTYKFSEDTIDEDVEKDDWVIITKNLYNDNNDIVVASKATGTVEATKDKTGWKQYQIGDEWFNETDSSNKDINTNVKPGVEAEYVAVNGILFYADKTSAGSDKLTDVLFVSYVGQDGLSNDQARVMFPNGDKATINLKNTYFTQQNGDKGTAIVPGQFYEYSKSGSTYELIALASTADFYGDFTYEGKEDLDTAGDKVDT